MDPDTDLPPVDAGNAEAAAPDAAEVSAAPVVSEEHPVEAVAPVAEATTAQAPALTVAEASRKYPSLYDSTGTTILAILLGIVIVGGIQYAVHRIYTKAKSEHELLTRFVVALVALVVGAYISDLLIAGPDTSLLSDDEHTIILGFIKDICLMVFAFYFGTKASGSSPSPGASE